MAFPELNMSIADRARDAKSAAEEIRGYARKVIVALASEFASEDAETFGVNLVHSEDGQSARISSPFGEARAKLLVFLDAGGLYGRYSFERKFTDSLDRDIWIEVYFLDIREDGTIISEFSGEESNRFSVPQYRRNQYFTLALAITTALGRNPADQFDALSSSALGIR